MNFLELDLFLLQLINKPISQTLNLFFIFLSYSIYAFPFLIGFYYYRNKQKEKFAHFLITLIIGFLFVSGLKYWIGRPRPYLIYPNMIHNILFGSDPSFPSRHTFLAFLLLRFIPNKNSKKLKYLLIIYLLSIPFSMLYIGVHYPSDILAGAFIGFIFPTILSEKISNRLLRSKIFSF